MSDQTETVPEDFAREFSQLLRKPDIIPVYMDHFCAWAIMSALQLALKHPDFPVTIRPTVEKVARGLQERVATTPALARVAEQGWQGD